MAEELNKESEEVVEVTTEETTDSVETKEDAAVAVAEEKPAKPARKTKSAGAIVSEPVAKTEDDSENLDALLDKLIAEEKSNGNVIGSVDADKKDAVPLDAEASKVAVYSSRNASWSGYGSVYKGYNILSKKNADKWLTRDHVRPATPAEVAQHLR